MRGFATSRAMVGPGRAAAGAADRPPVLNPSTPNPPPATPPSLSLSPQKQGCWRRYSKATDPWQNAQYRDYRRRWEGLTLC